MKDLRRSPGGKATAIINRKIALDKYNKNPNICKLCNKEIKVEENTKVSETRRKVFCSRSCAASFNNKITKKRIKIVKRKLINREKILLPKFNFLLNKSKIEIFKSHKNWQSARTSIRRHATYIFQLTGNNKKCHECGYDKHVEICHIKAVSDFSDDSSILDINHTTNLIALCPNHHWEYDNKLLKI